MSIVFRTLLNVMVSVLDSFRRKGSPIQDLVKLQSIRFSILLFFLLSLNQYGVDTVNIQVLVMCPRVATFLSTGRCFSKVAY